MTIRVGQPFEDSSYGRGGYVVVYRDGAQVAHLRFQKLAEAQDAATRLADQPHRMGILAVTWQRQTVRCGCGWREGKVRKADWEPLAQGHLAIAGQEEMAAAQELLRR